MIVFDVPNFRRAYLRVLDALLGAPVVKTETWQGVDTSRMPEAATHEVCDLVLAFPIASEDLAYHRQMIGPNHPWADDHFELDRASGEPLNPGRTWAQWPYANKANSFRDEVGQFNHTYAERYWPKNANQSHFGRLEELPFDAQTHRGIRYDYGDLNDVVSLLARNPLTRGAYLPVFFPEDTGIVHGDRVPCSLGYLFRMRDGRLSIQYAIRSCDFVRHFQDDVYLTVRLLLWVLDRLRERDAETWGRVKPGDFLMTAGSMHMFVNDRAKFVDERVGPPTPRS